MENDTFYGLTAGMTFEQVKASVISITSQPDLKGQWYNIIPQEEDLPYQNFACKITEKYGLTRICAWTKNIQTNPNGAQLYSFMSELRQKESLRYGPHRFYNVTKDGTETEPEKTFTLDLIKQKRYMLAVFNEVFGSHLPKSCQAVTLQAFARDEFSGNIHKKIHLLHDED